MAEYYRANFAISGADLSGVPLLNAVRATVQSWADESATNYKADSTAAQSGGDAVGESGFFWLEWKPEVGFRLDIRMATDGGAVEADIEVSDAVESDSDAQDADAASDSQNLAYSPSVVALLAEKFDCAVEGEPLASEVRRLREADAAEFVRDDLLSGERRLPIVAVTENAAGDALADADSLQSKLLGIARVITYSDAVAEIVNERIPRHHCYGGAVRVYGAGFSPEDRSWEHRYWAKEDAAALRANWREARDACMSRLESRSARRLYDRVSGEISRRRNADLIERVNAYRGVEEDAEAAQQLMDDMSEQHQESIAENERLKAAYAQLRDDHRRVSWENTQLKAMMSEKRDAAPAPEYAPPPAFGTVADAAEYAERNASRVRLLPNALKTAAKSNFRRPNEVWEALSTLSDCAAERVRGSLGKDVKDWLAERRVTYAANESQTTKGKYGAERTFDGVLMEGHVKLGRGGDPQNHLRIHLSWSEDAGEWLIGYIGAHLPTARG